MITKDLSTLKIHKLTQEQYDTALVNGNIDENALYLTPEEEIDLSPYATSKEVSSTYETKTDADDKLTEAKTYTDTVASNKADSNHNHDNDYDPIGSADTALASANRYTDTKVSNLTSATVVDNKISTHNTSTNAHNDIRALITNLTTKLNNFLNVDDTTTDQLSEVLTLIENNKGTLESLTTTKVNVSDIVDNLTTSSASKVLSANQGAVIKILIDALQAEVDSKSNVGHTHNYASSSSVGGAATSANKLNTDNGSATQPIYFSNGVPVACTHSLNKTVPSDAVFTDTTYNEATQTEAGLLSAEDKTRLDNGGIPIVTTSGDGATYVATIDDITALTTGMKITIIPHTNSTTTSPKLNVNSLGDKFIRMPVTYNTSATSVGATASWLVKNKPVTLEYDGVYWKTISIPRPSAQYLYGAVPIANGGTGATNNEDALINLGIDLQEGDVCFATTRPNTTDYHNLKFYRQGNIIQIKGDLDVLSYLGSSSSNNELSNYDRQFYIEGTETNFYFPAENTCKVMGVYITDTDGFNRMSWAAVKYDVSSHCFYVYNLPFSDGVSSAILHFDMIYMFPSALG